MLHDNRNCWVATGTHLPHTWIPTSERSQAVTGNELFRTITEEILDYVVREMTDPSGMQMLRSQYLPSNSSPAGTAGFYATQDADSEGEEGKFFFWTLDEVREVLGEETDAFARPRARDWERRPGIEGRNLPPGRRAQC